MRLCDYCGCTYTEHGEDEIGRRFQWGECRRKHEWFLRKEQSVATKTYLAGPMRAIPLLNHPAFDAGAEQLRAAGYEVFSPAEHDRALGIDPAGGELTKEGLRKVLGDDLAWITAHADGIATLPGWERSLGARAEVATALALGLFVAPVDVWTNPRGDVAFYTQAAAAMLDGTIKTTVPGGVA